MNWLGVTLVWTMLQISLCGLLGLAVYSAVRRKGPAAGSLALVVTLGTLTAVTALALSPWPNWWRPQAVVFEAAPPATSAGATPGVGESLDEEIGTPAASEGGLVLARELASAFWQELSGQKAATPSSSASPSWTWILATLFLVGAGLALVRLVAGVATVRRYRRRSRAVTDRELIELVEVLQAEMSLPRPIQVRESAALASPATIGWRKPLVLLPSTWREWTTQERRVVLAHELAHVARGDYGGWLFAQACLALHFYHPLVHWLVKRLRLEQELAADAWGALCAGGRGPYLAALAQMALKHDDRNVAWAARPFLPSRGTFLRRLDMLRHEKALKYSPSGGGTRVLVIGILAAAGIVVAGIKGPGGQQAAAQDAKPVAAKSVDGTSQPADGEIDLSYVPAKAAAMLVVRPAEFFAQPGMADLAKLVDEDGGQQKALGISVVELEEVRVVLHHLPRPNAHAQMRIVLKSKRPHDWAAMIQELAPHARAAKSGSKTYYVGAMAYYHADDRTIVFDTDEGILGLLLTEGKIESPVWAKAWSTVAHGQIAAAIDSSALSVAVGLLKQEIPASPELGFMTAFAPLWEGTQFVVGGASLGETADISVRLASNDARSTESVQQAAESLVALGKSSVGQFKGLLQGQGADNPEVQMQLASLSVAEAILSPVQVAVQAEMVIVSSQSDFPRQMAADVLAPSIMAGRQAGRRAASMNNMKQIGLAFHNYNVTHGHLPPAAVMGPDGKTPHSWRVALLPYLEQDALYRSYKMDEPWDSPANKKILEAMPAIYRAPGDTSTNTPYFVVTGAKTIFSGEKGTEFKDIPDGTSYTILTVEAKRDIPWTKPEDIAYDAESKELPELGGWHKNVFLVGMADGSVRTISQQIDPGWLRGLLTAAGGEVLHPF